MRVTLGVVLVLAGLSTIRSVWGGEPGASPEPPLLALGALMIGLGVGIVLRWGAARCGRCAARPGPPPRLRARRRRSGARVVSLTPTPRPSRRRLQRGGSGSRGRPRGRARARHRLAG